MSEDEFAEMLFRELNTFVNEDTLSSSKVIEIISEHPEILDYEESDGDKLLGRVAYCVRDFVWNHIETAARDWAAQSGIGIYSDNQEHSKAYYDWYHSRENGRDASPMQAL